MVCASKVYSGLGADIVYGIITLTFLRRPIFPTIVQVSQNANGKHNCDAVNTHLSRWRKEAGTLLSERASRVAGGPQVKVKTGGFREGVAEFFPIDTTPAIAVIFVKYSLSIDVAQTGAHVVTRYVFRG